MWTDYRRPGAEKTNGNTRAEQAERPCENGKGNNLRF